MNHAISINPDKTLVITVPEGTEVDRVKIRKMGTQESKLYWRDEVLDQYKWERDIAIQQLKELGYGFGQEPKTYGDTISRQAAIDVASRECHEWRGIFSDIEQGLKELPSVQSELAKYSPKLDNENGELISRQEAIDVLSEFLSDREGGNKIWWKPVAESIVNALPSAEPSRKSGKWIWCGNHHICSECDEWALTRWDEDECDEVDILTDFCPNCGVDMRGGKNESIHSK